MLFFSPLINAGEKWLYGCWFYRPNETFHLATRKFLEKEVFKSDYYNKAPISKILGKCVVMFVKVNTLSSNMFGAGFVSELQLFECWSNIYGVWDCRSTSNFTQKASEPRMSTSVSHATLPSPSPSRRSRCGPCPWALCGLFPERSPYPLSVWPPCLPPNKRRNRQR